MQRNITDILNEWFYRLPNGYAIQPFNDADLKVLEEVLNENRIHAYPIIKSLKENDFQLDQAFNDAKPVEEQLLNEGPSNEYDTAILDRLGVDTIPAAAGTYKVQTGKSFKLPIHPDDKETFEKLYPETAGSAIIGKGEIALYWCFNYQANPINTEDGRGGDAPDLIIGGERVEVKSYKSHTAQTGLGRWSEFKEGQKVVINLFGIDSLTQAFTPGSNVTVKSELSFTYKNISEAAQSLITFLNIGALPELISAYPIFKNIYDQCMLVLELINQRVPIMKLSPKSTPEEISTGVLNMLLLDKIGRKPGDGGYLANVKKGDPTDVYFHYMDFDRLKDIDTVAANVSNAGGAIKANFDKIFG